ncbi:hypothetical protein Clacol_001493 [Clathrus columnatus]|uniref:Inositol polyphosphate-related phosphatase domain-containing protein n=1 Tax=Clathrus columnatus TaxID=1419009 RepID=A0AAV5A1D0_9AGAM|nr:hypothetical protein Clacol_001493 [Clathrus columnatus]
MDSNVIWLADTNYRIDLDNETVRTLVASNNFDALIGVDQLKQMMDLKAVFSGFEEGPLLFPPTYRYDVGTDDYDTSEKMRTPSWTDRILYRGQLSLQKYSRSELRGSDHRPVYALFTAKIHKIDRIKQAMLRQQLLDEAFTQRKHQITRKLAPDEKGVEADRRHFFNGNGYPSDYVLVPPPSSDQQVWWEEFELSPGEFTVFAHGRQKNTNPFDSSSESSQDESPSSSDDELYSHAQKLPVTI